MRVCASWSGGGEGGSREGGGGGRRGAGGGEGTFARGGSASSSPFMPCPPYCDLDTHLRRCLPVNLAFLYAPHSLQILELPAFRIVFIRRSCCCISRLTDKQDCTREPQRKSSRTKRRKQVKSKRFLLLLHSLRPRTLVEPLRLHCEQCEKTSVCLYR